MLKKSMLTGIFSVFILSTISVSAQTANTLNNQEFLNFLSNYNFASSTPETILTNSTSTSSSEDIIYSKPIIVNNTINTLVKAPLEKIVYPDDILGVSITSKYNPSTPIEIFLLTYENNLTKKISIKFVYNEVMNVLKTYRLTMNQDLIDEIGDVDYFKIGFCVNGCKLIPIKMIISE